MFVLPPDNDLDCEIHVGENGYETENWKFDPGDKFTIISDGVDWFVLKLTTADGKTHWFGPGMRLGRIESVVR